MMPARYHPALVTLHWLLAALVLLSLAMGMVQLEEIPNDSPEKIGALAGHMIAGVSILVLMVIRAVVRLRTAHPPRATAGNAWLDRLARFNHLALYVLVIAMALSGITLSLQAGLPAIVFGGSGAPLPGTFAAFWPRIVHGAIAQGLAVLVLLHILAALFHQFVRRDNLIARMWFGKR